MSKNRKTRKEKLISELRRKLQTSSPQKPKNYQENKIDEGQRSNSPIFAYNFSSIKQISAREFSETTSYVKQDLYKTMILTFSIIVFELLLLLVFKKHIISLPMISY